MAIKELIRKLRLEIKKRENPQNFSVNEFYFPNDDEPQELDVGETHISISGKIQPEN